MIEFAILYKFLYYLQPTDYFRLFSHSRRSVFPRVDLLPNAIKAQLEVDPRYSSESARDYDLSWQAIQLGYIGDVATYSSYEQLPLEDEYRFSRKYFHAVWVFFVLVIRMLIFHHPIKELRAWISTKDITRHVFKQPIRYDEWAYFESTLLKTQPFVSVVIPTLNRYCYLKDVLNDLEVQDYKNFEVLIVDQSDHFDPSFYKPFTLNIHVIRQTEKALWLARNTAIKNAQGEFIALSEDDVRIAPDWISAHLKCLDFFNVHVSAGVFYPEGQQIPKARSYFALASQFATGNAMLYKTVFKQVGLFDLQFEKQRMGDGEFGMRVYLEGITSISNPHASCVDVKAATGGLREMGSWDAFRPTRWFSPRPIPSVLYYYRKYFGDEAARLALLKTVPFSLIPYQYKRNKPMLIFGLVLSLIMLPLVGFQVWKSWRLSSVKLKEGPLIDTL